MHTLDKHCLVCACDSDVTDEDKNFVKGMFQPTGLCYEAQEHQLNAYCALVGSGTGFVSTVNDVLFYGKILSLTN